MCSIISVLRVYGALKNLNETSIKDAWKLLVHSVQYLEHKTKPAVVSETEMDRELLMNMLDSTIAAFRTLFSVGSMLPEKERPKVMRE